MFRILSAIAFLPFLPFLPRIRQTVAPWARDAADYSTVGAGWACLAIASGTLAGSWPFAGFGIIALCVFGAIARVARSLS